MRRPRLNFDQQVLASALLAAAPGTLVALAFVWLGDYSEKLRWTVTLFLALFGLGMAFALRRRVIHPIYTLANLLEALREGDTSLRGRRGDRDDALGQVLAEVNLLGETLRHQRLDAREATALLRRVMLEIDVAIFAFDDRERLRLVNRAGARLLAGVPADVLGRTAQELGLDAFLRGDSGAAIAHAFPGGEGRWGVRRSTFRQEGRPHRLVVVADLSRALREEERQAWRRLIRVLGHELGNSLAPIKSMAATLSAHLRRTPRPPDFEDDLGRGLEVIQGRSEALVRFLATYSHLARLPPPTLAPVAVAPLVRRVAALETRLPVAVEPGPDSTLLADADQIEQLLINLVRNAADAVLPQGGAVHVAWRRRRGRVEISVDDDGPGLSNPENLFVPFYTTKPGGSGIGLALCRQIAEAHDGTVTLENRPGGGCTARLSLPVG